MTAVPEPSRTLRGECRQRGWPGPLVCAAVLFLLGLLSRWLTRTQLVQSWDAGNFVLALDHLNLALHQPHLPGVFWWLISLGRWARPLVGGDGVQALVLVNAVVSATALPVGWYLGYRFAGWRTSLWFVALLFSAPILWFYGSQPLSYGAELGWVVAIGCSAWCVSQGERRGLIPLALLMATASGIRPNTALFLLPLVLAACGRGWSRGLAIWRYLLAVLLGAGVLVWWLHAFLQEAGGLAEFWPQLMAWKRDHSQQARGDGPLGNAWLLIKTLALTAPFGLGLLLARWRSWPPAKGRLGWRQAFLLLWVLPSGLYFTLVHFTRMGHATTLLPGFLLALATWLAAGEGSARRLAWPRDVVVVLLLQSLLFLLVPGDRFASQLRSFDREWAVAIAAAKRFDPATTLVLTTGRQDLKAYRLPSVHVPAYDHDNADFELDQRQDTILVAPPIQRLVYLDRGLSLDLPALPGSRRQVLIPGRLQLIEIPVPSSGLQAGRRSVELQRP